VLCRLFEGAMGSGLGARVDLCNCPAGRKDGALFSEAVVAILLEVPPDVEPMDLFGGLPWFEVGEVIDTHELVINDAQETLLKVSVCDLVKSWEKPFTEVVG